MINWIKDNKSSIIRNSFLLPILLVVIMSISHVVSWYDLGNPISWAIYLSIAIEVFALASVSASTIKMSRSSIWFLFGLVTLIQIVGNIFFEFRDINELDANFIDWVKLIDPFFTDWDSLDHRRLLAIFQGGTLPIMSLTALHYYIKFTDMQSDTIEETEEEEVELLKELEDDLVDDLLEADEVIEETDDISDEVIIDDTEAEIAPDVIEPVDEIEIKDHEDEEIGYIDINKNYPPKIPSKKRTIEPETELTEEEKEMNAAINFWGKMKGPYNNIPAAEILQYYRENIKTDPTNTGKNIDTNTGRFEKK